MLPATPILGLAVQQNTAVPSAQRMREACKGRASRHDARRMTSAPEAGPRPQHRPLAGIAFIVASVAVFAFSDAGAKWLTASYVAFQVVFLRSCFTMVFLAGMVHRAGGVATLRTTRPWAHALRALLVVGAIVGLIHAFSMLPLADAYAIGMSLPVLTTALSVPLLGERVDGRQWIAIAIGFGGAIVAANPAGDMLQWGTLAAIGSTLCFAIFFNLTRRLSTTEGNATILFYSNTAVLVVSGLLAIGGWASPGAADLGLFAVVGILAGVGQYLATHAFRLAPPAVVSPFEYLGMPCAAVLGYVLWRDIPGPHVWAGAALIVASGLYLVRREARATRTLPSAS